MPDIRTGDTVRFRFGMQVQSVENGIVKLRWVEPCKNCIGVEVHEFTVPAACLEVVGDMGERVAEAISAGSMVVSETPSDALASLALNGYAIFPNRVPIDPDAGDTPFITSD